MTGREISLGKFSHTSLSQANFLRAGVGAVSFRRRASAPLPGLRETRNPRAVLRKDPFRPTDWPQGCRFPAWGQVS